MTFHFLNAALLIALSHLILTGWQTDLLSGATLPQFLHE